MSETDLTRAFRSLAEVFLSKYPNLDPKWNPNSKVDLEMEIPPQNENGFAVTAMVRGREIIVFGAGSHHHFDEAKDPGDLTSDAFGLIYDLLSRDMRVIEYTAGGKSYKWQMQVLHDGEWNTEITTGLLAWRFFSNREKRILQNDVVPPREEMMMEHA